MRTTFRASQLKTFGEALLKLFPPVPLSDNELHDSYTRICNFSIYIKEYLRRELGWTESQFSEMVLASMDGRNTQPTKEEIAIARVIIKTQLRLLLQYLEISPSLVNTLKKAATTSDHM